MNPNDYNFSSDPQIAVQQMIAGLTTAVRVQKQMLIDHVAGIDPVARLVAEERYKELYSQMMQEYLEGIERFDPALAAKIDYRKIVPPI